MLLLSEIKLKKLFSYSSNLKVGYILILQLFQIYKNYTYTLSIFLYIRK
jgi:hypothetical protein